ncbi:MAG TPA: histidine kinase [Verrucomicrobiae bacterium]|nr:histidine kinase [Verrucomicrobiae bacterium]
MSIASREKAPAISRAYWLCQLAGWSALVTFQLIILAVLAPTAGTPTPRLYIAVVVLGASGFILSHLIYLQIRRRRWLHIPLKTAWPRLAAAIALAAVVQNAINLLISIFLVHLTPLRENLRPAVRFISWLIYVALFAIWLMVYLAVHEFRHRRVAEVHALRLELVAQEAQLRGLRAQLNPHFLFNCLNSLRELIVEDPPRAQTMVTQLSGLLRYSLQSDHLEQVLLEDEVEAVKDYLALEAIRFEERLRVRWSIAPDAGQVPVPPMVLQTLVENALKHGISRRPEGGEISIKAAIRNSRLELEVVNSGELSGHPSGEGIGLRNARARLQLLYGDKAKIVLENVNGAHGQVRAAGIIPVKRGESVP